MAARVVGTTLLVAFALGVIAACSEAPGDYCDTPGVCTLPDGAVPDAKKDASDASAAVDASGG